MAKEISKETLKALTDEELIIQAKELYESIYVIVCYGRRDILLLRFMYTELARRGYEIEEKRRSVIIKKAKT